jgi:choline dehydrogenase-like flavoprotein
MTDILVIGSGPSGIHLAKTLLDLGRGVTLLDVGHERPPPILPGADFDGLKRQLDDPVSYFLGSSGTGVVFPSHHARYFGFPPSKDYVFSRPAGFETVTANFDPLISFAAGGLAEAWTAGCYPMNAAELSAFPFDFASIEPHYAEIARRIGIAAARDDLERFSPWFGAYLEPLPPDAHAESLMAQYKKRRAWLQARLGFYLGRSRVAMLTRDHGQRLACDRLGRCLWGCPRGSLYAPSSTLAELRAEPGFRYVRDAFVTHFEYDGERISSAVAVGSDGMERRFSADAYALAACTLCSSKILLDTFYRRTGQIHELGGLMDNSQLLIPFLTLRRIGKPVDTHSYQFHQLAVGIEQALPEEYIHGQITTLKSASVHPVAQSMPVDLRTALDVFRISHAALGAANVWLPDRRRAENVLTLRARPGTQQTDLVVRFAEDSPDRFDVPLAIMKRALRKLGCVVPPGMTKRLPRGSSVHYAGTVPMQHARQRFTCDPDCRSHDFRNLYFADGASFPFLPAKNLTFTLMANAVRVAHAMHRELAAVVLH